ncbi:hypothetical protein [Methylobacterium sp. sgz302541]|uniref:hypothetical protein n=1 Tax=unclassified Methylobacterium TaxID=2615210 RepID=UPI003D325B19
MTIQPIITSATSDAQREEAERVGVPSFVRGFEGWLATTEAFQGQNDIDGAALASGIATIRAQAEAGFDAGIYLDLQGSRSPGGLPIWEEALLAALATHIGLAGDVDPGDLETARRIGLA